MSIHAIPCFYMLILFIHFIFYFQTYMTKRIFGYQLELQFFIFKHIWLKEFEQYCFIKIIMKFSFSLLLSYKTSSLIYIFHLFTFPTIFNYVAIFFK